MNASNDSSGIYFIKLISGSPTNTKGDVNEIMILVINEQITARQETQTENTLTLDNNY